MRQTVLITGASSGLGWGMAVEFAARGYDLALCARRSDRLEELRQELEVENPGSRVRIRDLDVRDPDAVFETFRAQNAGHLVAISSVSAMRGMPGNMTAYAATKAGLAALAEGVRVELMHTPIRVSTIFPGFIRSPINEDAARTPFIIDSEKGCRVLVRTIEQEPETACVPAWPWIPIGWLLRNLPLRLAARMM